MHMYFCVCNVKCVYIVLNLCEVSNVRDAPLHIHVHVHVYFSLPISAYVIIKCEAIWSLMRSFSSGQPPVASLPPPVQRDLICCLVKCGVGDTRQQYLTEVGLYMYMYMYIY